MEHHHPPHLPDSQKPTSPQTSYSSESEQRAGMTQAGATKKRPSRAGTRSVSTLTAAQLERKRANDREAQRAIRQRTKEHIENLERRIAELTSVDENGSKLMELMRRNEALEHENAMLRSQLGQGVGVYPPEGEGIGADSSLLAGRSPPGRIGMPGQPRLSSTPTPRVATMTPGVSQAEHWQHGTHSSPASTTIGASSSTDPSAWSQHQHSLPRPLGQQDSSQHGMHQVDVPVPAQAAPSGYGYPVQYQTSEQVPMSYEQQQTGHASNPYHQMDYQSRTMAPDVTQQATASYPSYQGHQAYMPGAQIPQPAQQSHGQGSQHMMYNIAPNMKPRQ